MDTFAEVPQWLPTDTEVLNAQVQNLMAERDLLRAVLAGIVEVVSAEKNASVWAADLQTCTYTHAPFTQARQLLGLSDWLDELMARNDK